MMEITTTFKTISLGKNSKRYVSTLFQFSAKIIKLTTKHTPMPLRESPMYRILISGANMEI